MDNLRDVLLEQDQRVDLVPAATELSEVQLAIIGGGTGEIVYG